MDMFFCKTCQRPDLNIAMFIKTSASKSRIVKTCVDCRTLSKKSYDKNREKKLAYAKKYRKGREEYFSQYRKNWLDNNREHYNQNKVERRKNDERFRAIDKGQSIPRRVMKTKNMTEELHLSIGCTKDEFIAHIESQFLEGMTWGNRSTIWEFDHIFPISRAYDHGPEIFKMAIYYLNVRPFWKEQQLVKGFSIPKDSYITRHLIDNGIFLASGNISEPPLIKD